MDYLVWPARSPKRCVLIDLGYQEELAAEKKHTYHFNPVEGIKALGITSAILICSQMRVCISRMRNSCIAAASTCSTGALRKSFRIEDVTSVLGRLYDGQVKVYEGEAEPVPGITLHHIGGHAPGLQVARVRTKRGQVVVASDALHFFYNFEAQNPFPTVVNVAEMVEGWHTILALAGGDKSRLVPGHDPIVFTIYPPVVGAAEGMAVRLDEAPDMK